MRDHVARRIRLYNFLLLNEMHQRLDVCIYGIAMHACIDGGYLSVPSNGELLIQGVNSNRPMLVSII
jgi:hypothetical protein